MRSKYKFGRSAAVVGLAMALASTGSAETWIGGPSGNWGLGANWNNGVVPNNSGGWAIGEVINGTAVINSLVPNVSEAWAGNGGIAGHIVVTNGGTLNVDNWLVMARMYESGSVTPFSSLTVDGGVVNKRGDGFVVGDNFNGLASEGLVTIASTGQVYVTGGWMGIGNGTGSKGTLRLKDTALLDAQGYDFNIGDFGDSRGYAYIQDQATLKASKFWIGKSDNAAGVLVQTGGTVLGTGGSANEWTIGGNDAVAFDAYGFYNLAGGTLTCPFNYQLGRYGKGVYYQSGGTNTQSGWSAVGRMTGSYGVAWISGGLYAHTGTGSHQIVGEEGRGEMSVTGNAVLETASSVVVGNGSASGSGTGLFNLKGGTVRAPRFERWSTGMGYLSFNGGTLQATATEPAYMRDLTDVRIYSGNAIIDTAGYDITIEQPLLGAVGYGVSTIPVADGGAGYVAPPVVQISGDGAGAMAVAQIDAVAGKVTSIVVLCPGFGYNSPPAVTLMGGGATVPATAGSPTIALVSSGGLVKNGAGSLVLSGAGDFTGASVVNAGKLMVSTAHMGAGSYVAKDGAELGVLVTTTGGQLAVSSVTAGVSSGAKLGFDLGSFGNPPAAPLNVMGTLTLNGTITIDVAANVLQPGQFPLIQYGSRAGNGTLVLGALPSGVQAALVNNTAARSIDLHVTSVSLPRWDGQVSGIWDINTTPNWIDLASGAPTKYADGTPALFDDNAMGTTDVSLAGTVKPASVIVTNEGRTYSFAGPGKISGSTGLTKQGAGSLTITSGMVNDYTGPTRIAGGTLAVPSLANGGAPSSIGAASPDPANLVLATGTLRYTGPATAVNRGYTLESTNNTFDVSNDLTVSGAIAPKPGSGFVKTGAGTLTYNRAGSNQLSGGAWPGFNVLAGKVVFDGSAGPQTNRNANEFWIGSGLDSGATLMLTNTALNVDSWLAIGRGNGTVGHPSSAVLYDSALRSGNFSMGYDNGVLGNLSSQTLTLNGTSTFTNNGDMNIGESGGSSSAVFLNGSSKLYSGWRMMLGWHTGSTGTLTAANSSAVAVNAWLSIGNEDGTGSMLFKDNSSLWVLWDLNVTDVGTGIGDFTARDNASVAAGNVFVAKGAGSTGTLNLQGNARVKSSSFYVANASGSIGTVNQSGGTVETGGGNVEFQIGARSAGTWNQTGGIVNTYSNWTSIGRFTEGVGVLNVSGGSFSHLDPTRIMQVGEDGNGTLNVSGTGVVRAGGDRLQIASAASSAGTVNLNGGTLIARRVASGAGSSAFNLNGGVLMAGPGAGADFMGGLGSVTVSAGGAIIDTSSNSIAIDQALLAGGGGLTKLGSGTLWLNGQNTYAGSTLVNAGALGGHGVILGPVTVGAGAALAPGVSVGTLSISNALTFSAGSTAVMTLNKAAATNDLVQGVTSLKYAGSLVLSNLAGNLAVGDTFKLFSAGSYSGSFSSVVSSDPAQDVTWDTSRLAIDGTVRVTSVTAKNPPSIATDVVNGQLSLTWPAGYTGWRLLGQTNSLSVGLSNNWSEVVGSTGTNQVSIPLETGDRAVFFKLVRP